MVSPMSCCGLTLLPPAALGNPFEHVLVYSDLRIALASTLALVAAAFVVLLRVEAAKVYHIIRQRLQAVWNPEPTRVVTPLRRGVGGSTGRVPPRSAAGSTFPPRLVAANRGRRR
jgi:hypothetical protein